MTYKGSEVSVAYIYGGCTAPNEREQGLMKQLMQKAFETIKNRDVTLAVLIPAEPWLFDAYRKEGFTEAFNYSPTNYTQTELVCEKPNSNVPNFPVKYNSFLNCISHALLPSHPHPHSVSLYSSAFEV